MSAIDPLPAAGEDAAQSDARVSTKRGWWSVVLASGSALVAFVGGLGGLIVLGSIFGSMGDPDFLAAYGVAMTALGLLLGAMLIAAVVLGVTSIVGAARRSSRPGRTTAIVLGCIGIALSALMTSQIFL